MAKDGHSDDEKRAAGLRQLAEREVALTSAELSVLPPDSLKALVHELQVHQVELDLQNEELRRVQFDLAEAKHAAEAANLAKSRFLAMMSHELRTPMTAILGMCELALAEPLSTTVREYLNTLKGSADSLLGLLNDLLDFSRVEAGKLTLEAAAFGLRRTVGEVVESLEMRARQKGLKLVCDFPDDVPDRVVGDSLRLYQILLILADNAIKFTSQGVVAVRVTMQTRSSDDVRLQFSVSDTGIGIAPERRKEIFDPFTQADVSTTRRYGGSGLGLAIAANLVALMDGRIWLESESGQGSTFLFSVRLPLSHEPAHEAAVVVEPPPLAAPARPLRILVAEDTRSSQQVIAAILRKRGHTVTLADDGRQAIDLVAGGDFDAILMDVQMPVLDGLQAAAAIRALPPKGKPGPPIIALTAHAYRDDAERCTVAGMDGFLGKPVKSGELIDLVERLAATASGASCGAGVSPAGPCDAGVSPAPAAETAAPQESTTVFSYDDALKGCLDNPELLRDIIEFLFEEAGPLLKQACEGLKGCDAEKMGKAVHRLKGTVIHLGAPAAKEALRRVEHLGFSNDLTDAEAALRDAEAQIDLLEQALAEYRRKKDNSERSTRQPMNAET